MTLIRFARKSQSCYNLNPSTNQGMCIRHPLQKQQDAIMASMLPQWSIQKGRTISEEGSEPVPIETCLGWMLSGPMKGFRDDPQISVNLVGQIIPRDNRELENGVRKLWDLETHSFNGERYKVSLPWKEGHGSLLK